MTNELKRKFDSLVGRLSPENLTCDGEASQSGILRERRAIIKEWRALEAEVGRKVSECEAEGFYSELEADDYHNQPNDRDLPCR